MKTILVFAPHPDDEIIGCGGYLALHQASGCRITVTVITDGSKGLAHGQSIETRQQECLNGLKLLSINKVQFFDYPDGQVPLSGPIIDKILTLVRAITPTEILLPVPTEHHPDHRRVTRLVIQTLEDNWQGRLLFYETVSPTGIVNHQVDITRYFDQKIEALKAHASQLSQFPYEENCRSLARLRGIALNVQYGEGFLAFDWDGSRQNFFETLPLISVIIRASQLDFLKHALASLTQQQYDHIEIVLVWFGEDQPDLSLFHFLDLNLISGQANRSLNLNLGLNKARGDYICFLDEDDILYPQHLSTLLAAIHGMPEIDMVYSGVRVVSCTQENSTVKVERQLIEINSEVAPGRLLLGNTIPIHSALYRANLFHTHRFSEDLEVYEDWELISRLYLKGYTFQHVDEVTCEYRLFNAKGEGLDALTNDHLAKGYLPFRQKVLQRIIKKMEVEHLENIALLVTGQEEIIKKLRQTISHQSTKIKQLELEAQESYSLKQLLAHAFDLLSIDKPGRDGVAKLLGRSLPQALLFSIVLPIHNTPADLLSAALQSVADQAYPGWELCIVDDGSDKKETRELIAALEQAEQFNGRLHLKRLDRQNGIVAASMEAVALGQAPYLVFLDHDDLLHQEALLHMAMALTEEKKYDLLYTDSRMIDRAGEVLNIYRKPDWAPETLLHLNYINHLTVVSRTAFNDVGGLRSTYEGLQDWDLLLRLLRLVAPDNILHIQEVLYDWRAAEGSFAYSSNAKKGAFEAGKDAVADHINQLGYTGVRVEANPVGIGMITEWQANLPGVTAIIPTHANVHGLRTCLDGLQQETEYQNLRIIIVANRVDSPEMITYLDSLPTIDQLEVITNDCSFNWSQLNNEAVRRCNSPLLLLLNDDVEIIEKTWLKKMVRYVQLKNVGAAGATLHYPDGSLQHNGIVTNTKWIADNITTLGSRKELSMTRNVSAVTGACQLITRETYELANGFDERLSVNFGDVDICLAMRQHGFRIVQAADVRLIHHEMISRGPIDNQNKQDELNQAMSFMQEKWGEMLTERYLPKYEIIAHGTRILHMQ